MDKEFLIRKRSVVCAGALLILLTGILLYHVALKNRLSEWLLSGYELTVQKKVADIRQKNLEEYDDNLSALAKAEAEAAEIENHVLAYHRIPDSLSKVDAWLAEYRLAVSSFAASGYEELEVGGLPDVRIYRARAVVEGSGRYEDILLCLAAVEQDPAYYSVDRLTLAVSESKDMRFVMDFSLYAYKAGRDSR